MTVKRVPWNFIVVLCTLSGIVIILNVSTYQQHRMGAIGLEDETSPQPVPLVRDVISTWKQQLVYQSSLPPVAGFRSSAKKFLSIGISTVYRKENYLVQTLSSFINESTPEEREIAVIIIYLADTETSRKELQLRLIQDNFQPYLDSGFIQVIESTSAIYPPMDFALTKRTFNDSVDRVIWRTKQVVDFAFLFSYARNLSDFYLVAEDDIITTTQYISAIKEFVQTKDEIRWIALEFSEFLCIGLLFRNSDLSALTELILMFHQYQPVDLLMRKFIELHIPDKKEKIRRIPSIFQHMGVSSSLPNKVQKVIDGTFGLVDRKFKNRNPPANLSTTMKIFNGLTPDYPYKQAPGYFWGIPENSNETFDIVFTHPINISRIVIISGIPKSLRKISMKDIILDGTLHFSQKCVLVTKVNLAAIVKCVDFHPIAQFVEGSVDFRSPNLTDVFALRIKIGPTQKSWVIIREIEIFVRNDKIPVTDATVLTT